MELKRTHYYYSTPFTVPMAAVDQVLDVRGGITPASTTTPAPNRLVIATDIDITVKINCTSAAEIPVTAAAGLTIPADCRLEISKLYFSHMGASSALGDATVTVLAI